MSQVEVPKLVETLAVGPAGNQAAASKLVMYVVAVPDDSTDDGSNKQGHCYGRIVRGVD